MPDHGWYSDPADAARERWWDGRSWTNNVRPVDDTSRLTAGRPEEGEPVAALSARRRQPLRRILAIGAAAALVAAVGGAAFLLPEGGGAPKTVDFRTYEPLPNEELFAVSPDGRLLLVSDGPRTEKLTESGLRVSDYDHVCVRAIDERSPRACTETEFGVGDYVGAVSWSADSRRVAFADSFFVRREGGAITVLDVETGQTWNLGTPSPQRAGDERYHGPALSNDGERLAAVATRHGGGVGGGLVVLDLEGGDERQIAQLRPDADFSRPLWSADDEILYVSSGSSNGESASVDIIAADGSPVTSLEATVDLSDWGEGDSDGLWTTTSGPLVQVDPQERFGLLFLDRLAGSIWSLERNLSFLAILDLEEGGTAPVLPLGAISDLSFDYYVAGGGRFSADGGFVYLTYLTERPGTASETDVILARLPVSSVLDGSYDIEVIIEGIGGHLGLTPPVNVGNLGHQWQLPMPAAGASLLVGLDQPSDPQVRHSGPEHFGVVVADRDW
jgi:hypothetical protein